MAMSRPSRSTRSRSPPRRRLHGVGMDEPEDVAEPGFVHRQTDRQRQVATEAVDAGGVRGPVEVRGTVPVAADQQRHVELELAAIAQIGEQRLGLLQTARSRRLAGEQVGIGDRRIVAERVRRVGPPVDPGRPGDELTALVVGEPRPDAMPGGVEQLLLHGQPGQHAEVRALALPRGPTEFRSDPPTERRPLTVDVVALLQQADIGCEVAQQVARLLGTALELVGAALDVPDHHAERVLGRSILRRCGSGRCPRQDEEPYCRHGHRPDAAIHAAIEAEAAGAGTRRFGRRSGQRNGLWSRRDQDHLPRSRRSRTELRGPCEPSAGLRPPTNRRAPSPDA